MSEALPLVPSFSEQQVHNLANIVRSVVHQYFAPLNQSPPNQPSSNQLIPASTPPTPQKAQKEEDEQLQKQEQQATVESTTESTTKHGSMPDSKSIISTIPHLCTARFSGDSAACLSNLACQHIMFLNTLLGYTLLGYIEHSEGLEATGQG